MFNSQITRKLLSPGELVRSEAVKLLRILMQDLSLRRRKDMSFDGRKLIELPPIKEFCYKVGFETQDEINTYQKLERQAKGMLKSSDQGSTFQVLEILLRMRQAACSLDLISTSRLALLDQLEAQQIVIFTEENKLLLRDFLSLSVETNEECPICMEILGDISKVPVVTHCKHVFCKECIVATIENSRFCPLCRSPLEESQVLELPPTNQLDRADLPSRRAGASSKITALINILKLSRQADRTTKTVVFSQWTKLLDLIQPHLAEANIRYCRIDGTMSTEDRDASIRQLKNESECIVMLASLSVASVGLNLVMANQVILCDPWWAPAVEDQSVDRVYRLGQTRPVTVYKLVVENSIEDRVLEIQERKRQMTNTAGSGMTREQAAQSRRSDIEALLGTRLDSDNT